MQDGDWTRIEKGHWVHYDGIGHIQLAVSKWYLRYNGGTSYHDTLAQAMRTYGELKPKTRTKGKRKCQICLKTKKNKSQL